MTNDSKLQCGLQWRPQMHSLMLAWLNATLLRTLLSSGKKGVDLKRRCHAFGFHSWNNKGYNEEAMEAWRAGESSDRIQADKFMYWLPIGLKIYLKSQCSLISCYTVVWRQCDEPHLNRCNNTPPIGLPPSNTYSHSLCFCRVIPVRIQVHT